jgi:uncharacterized protein
MMNLVELIARKTLLNGKSITASILLFEEGATIPFIARYRKAQTGGLDEEQLRTVLKAYTYFTELLKRKETVLKTIDQAGKLTEELRRRIEACDDDEVLEDLYLPYKPKRRTKAQIAIEQGLQPLAQLITSGIGLDAEKTIKGFIQGDICTQKEALQGAQYIIAEQITEEPTIRNFVRATLKGKSQVGARKKKTDHKDAYKFELYEDFVVDIQSIKPHQLLALNRGEQLGILSVQIQADNEQIERWIANYLKVSSKLTFHDEYLGAIKLAVSRYLEPSIEREVRKLLKESADAHAIGVFSANLRSLLLQPPFSNYVVMGIDPGFASGCKVAVVDKTGGYKGGTIIYPTPPRNQVADAERKIVEWIARHAVDIIAIGNGTASRETELFIAQTIAKHRLSCKYLIVSEAGASVYSASDIARKEFPQLDATERGNISIARRVQDPLAELVKIDPKSLGVGLYQHDVDETMLDNELAAVVESCVNEVGVDLNTASARLLSFVSGLNDRIAQEIVNHRNQCGPFRERKELMKVKGIGEKVFEQSAGFLRIRGGVNPLDNTGIHPESYDKVLRLAQNLGLEPQDIRKLGLTLAKLEPRKVATLCQLAELDEPTFELITQNLQKPGRDPREDVPLPLLRSDVLKLEDLKIGMQLQGTIRNVVDFGAFVDIGLKNDALLHVSKMARPGTRRVNNPLDVVKVGDVVDLTIENIDLEKERVSLAMHFK